MSCKMEGQPLLDTAKVGNFLEISVNLLVCKYRKEFTVPIGLMPIFGDDTLRNVKKQHIGFHACLLSFGHNPLLVVKRNDVVRRKVGHVYICQTCKAREDENIPYQFQAVDTEILVGNLHDFLVSEEATVYRFIIRKTKRSEKIKRIVLSRKTKRLF